MKVKRTSWSHWGIELAIKKVYGKSYEELKGVHRISNQEMGSCGSTFVYEFSRGVGEFVNHFRPKIYDGNFTIFLLIGR